MKSKNSKQYRNEIKYLLNGVSREALFIQYKISSLLLSKLHPDRWVNNIYFDNINLDLFNQSIEGMSRRAKVRLRWYGDFYNIENNSTILVLGKKNPVTNRLTHNNLTNTLNNLMNSLSTNDNFSQVLSQFLTSGTMPPPPPSISIPPPNTTNTSLTSMNFPLNFMSPMTPAMTSSITPVNLNSSLNSSPPNSTFGENIEESRVKYESQLKMLKDMGFLEEETCIQALIMTNGNVDEAVSWILNLG